MLSIAITEIRLVSGYCAPSVSLKLFASFRMSCFFLLLGQAYWNKSGSILHINRMKNSQVRFA